MLHFAMILLIFPACDDEANIGGKPAQTQAHPFYVALVPMI